MPVLWSFFGLMAHGKVPAMLNFSTGAINMAAACVAANVTTIVTSRRFIETAEMQKDIEVLGAKNKIIYLEDVRKTIGTSDKIYGIVAKFFPKFLSSRAGAVTDPNTPAVVLFTSGSEGVPKGVVLSHRNLNANWQQAAARIAFTPEDLIFNALPVFQRPSACSAGCCYRCSQACVHSFTLRHCITKSFRNWFTTPMPRDFGTDTFLTGYAKNAHPYDFYNIRLAVAGLSA